MLRKLTRWWDNVCGFRKAKLRILRQTRKRQAALRKAVEFIAMCNDHLTIETDPMERVRIINEKFKVEMLLISSL